MTTNEDWVTRLDRQWLSLYETETVLSVLLEDGEDVESTRCNLERYASDYARSVRRAPVVALLQHASNVRKVS